MKANRNRMPIDLPRQLPSFCAAIDDVVEIIDFIDSLGALQSFRHYVTGPLVPNTRGKYCPA